jgi:hypothetical protein
MVLERRPFWLLGVVLLSLTSLNLKAQLNRGVLEGTVSDPQGMAVPAVQVAITNLDTNVAVTTVTNSAGYYRVPDLVPGKYSAHFVSTGFSTEDISGIEVSAGHVIRVDAQLKMGATHQTIEVKAGTAMVETAPSNFSDTIDKHTVDEMPLAGRDLQQLVYLVPGVNQAAGPPGSNFGFNSEFGSFPDPTHVFGSDISVNGGQGGDNAWYLDGNLNLSGFAENVAVNPTPDAVQEFQAITSAFSAEYGRTGGAVFNVVLKSGANAVHGDTYEYVRNDATNARNPFTSIDALGHIIKDRQLRFNNFGGTLGGPVVIPHVYNGKNRTFFFFSGDISILHLLGEKAFTVPTGLMRTGDFSEDPNVVTNGIWNPYSTVGPDVNGIFQRTAFGTPVAGNPFGAQGCLNSSVEAGASTGVNTCNFATQIPANMLDPTAMFFMKSFPQPNYLDPLSNCPLASGGTTRICDNYLGTVGSSQDPYNFSIKVDHQWSDKSKFFVEWLYSPGKYNNYRVPWTGPTFPNDATGFGSNYPVDFESQVIALGNTYTFTPTAINEFRFNFARQSMNSHPQNPYPESITDESQVKQLLAPLQIPEDVLTPVPNWGMSMPGGASITFGPTEWVNMTTMAESYNFLDNLTKVAGKHTLKAGMVYRLEHSSYYGPFPTGFTFSGNLAEDPTTGLGATGLSQFMMGAISDSGRDSFTGVQDKPYNRSRYWAAFFQDDYRIRPSFTLNIGVRYDLNGLFKTRLKPDSNFCLSCMNPLTGLPGEIVYEGSPQLPTGHDIAPANKNDIAPRVNFAWTPFTNHKTVVRGGYDIFYSNAFAAINAPGQSSNNMPGWTQEYDWDDSFYPNQCASFTGNCVAFPLSDATTNKGTLSDPPFTSVFPAMSKSPELGVGELEFFTPPSHDPMMESWGVEVQRELPGNMMLSVGYAGTHGTHLMGESFRQFNYVHTADVIKYGTSLNSEVPISNYYSGNTANLLAQVYGSTDLPLSILLKPYPFYGATSTLQDQTAFDGTSIYHGMNVKLEKRASHGLNFLVAYTYSKKITNADISQPFTLLTDPIHWARAGGLGGRGGQLTGSLFGAFQDPDNKKEDRAVGADDIPQMLNIAGSYELPFGVGRPFLNRKGAANAVLGGWRLTSSFNAESGVPLSIGCPSDQVTSRCNLIGNPRAVPGGQNASDWINPAAFEPAFGNDQSFWANYDPTDPRAYLFGTAGTRLPNLRSPGFWNLDSSLAKAFHFTESKYLEFRWEMFNALNHQSLGLPSTGFCLPPLPDGSTDLVHQDGCLFGRITNVQIDPRSMEFALKFFW